VVALPADQGYSFLHEATDHLLVELGGEIVPLARIYDNPSLRRKYFAPDQALKADRDRALLDPSEVQPTGPPEDVIRNFLFSVGDVHLNATGYPVLNFLRRRFSRDRREVEAARSEERYSADAKIQGQALIAKEVQP
jgi:hypothetical protein